MVRIQARRALAAFLLALPLAASGEVPAAADGGGLLQAALGLGAVLALLVGGAWLMRRGSLVAGSRAGLLKVIAATAVGPRERVVLVQAGDTWLVIGVAPGRVAALHTLPASHLDTDPARDHSMTAYGSFPDRLKQFLERGRGR